MRWKPSIVFLGGALILSLPGVANGDAPRRAPARCTDEVPLAIMAGELLLDGDMPTDAELLRNLREAGSDLPVVHALRTKPEDEGRRQSWLDGLRERHEASLVCGKASSPSETLWLVAPRGGELTVHGNRVRAEIRPPFMKPRLVLRDAKGTVRTMPVKGGEEIDLPTDLDPPLTVQLMADGPRGPRPVAELHPRSEL
ncbi:MAG: hypothetical protein KC416_11425, partial [Myxococcales bacterium]|nr:hypothetical protein [Myxococcales bacterium]